MSLNDEIDAVQELLDRLATLADDEQIERYRLNQSPMPPGLYWRLRWLVGLTVRWLEGVGLWPQDPWPVSLKQSRTDARAKPMLIWALGTDRETLRLACEGFLQIQNSLEEFAPVLITDVADFAFFSRLGWLVEYVPQLSGEGERYDERKVRFLARLYRGAIVLPVSVGLQVNQTVDDIRRLLVRNA